MRGAVPGGGSDVRGRFGRARRRQTTLDAYDEAVFETEASCEAEKTALFAEFERKRDELARRDASPRARKK